MWVNDQIDASSLMKGEEQWKARVNAAILSRRNGPSTILRPS